MFLGSHGVWFEFAESKNLFFRKDDCNPTLNLYSFTNNG